MGSGLAAQRAARLLGPPRLERAATLVADLPRKVLADALGRDVISLAHVAEVRGGETMYLK